MSETQHDVRVWKAKSDQSEVIADGFHCSADRTGLTAFGLERGDQVRVIRSPDAYALYTVTEERREAYDNVHVADPGDQYAGEDPENLVNWLTADGFAGIQIEQPSNVRVNFWQPIAEGVASVFARVLQDEPDGA